MNNLSTTSTTKRAGGGMADLLARRKLENKQHIESIVLKQAHLPASPKVNGDLPARPTQLEMPSCEQITQEKPHKPQQNEQSDLHIDERTREERELDDYFDFSTTSEDFRDRGENDDDDVDIFFEEMMNSLEAPPSSAKSQHSRHKPPTSQKKHPPPGWATMTDEEKQAYFEREQGAAEKELQHYVKKGHKISEIMARHTSSGLFNEDRVGRSPSSRRQQRLLKQQQQMKQAQEDLHQNTPSQHTPHAPSTLQSENSLNRLRHRIQSKSQQLQSDQKKPL